MKHPLHAFESRFEGVRVRDVAFDPLKSRQAVRSGIAHRLFNAIAVGRGAVEGADGLAFR
jgi:hypothetical protein